MFGKPSDVNVSKVEWNNTIGEEGSDQEDDEDNNFAAIIKADKNLSNSEEKGEADEEDKFTTAKT